MLLTLLYAFGLFLLLYFAGWYIKPIGRMYSFVFVLIGRVGARIEQLLDAFQKERVPHENKYPGLSTIVRIAALLLASVALLGETCITYLSLSALFDGLSSAPSVILGLGNVAMAGLFMSIPALFGACWLEKYIPEEARLFQVPAEHAQKFERFIKIALVLSILNIISFYTLRPFYLANPDSGVTALLQLITFVLLGLIVPCVGVVALYILALGLQTITALPLTLVWFAVSAFVDTCEFIHKYFTNITVDQIREMGVRDYVVVKEVTEQNPSPVLQIEKTVTQVIEADKVTSDTLVKEYTSSDERKDEVEIIIPPKQDEEIIISKQDEELYQTVLQIVEQRKREAERIAEEKRKAEEETRKQEAWGEVESEIKKRASSDWRNFDAEAEALYVLDHCLPVDVVLSEQEYREWRIRLRAIGEATRKEEQEREEEEQKQAQRARHEKLTQHLVEHKAIIEQVIANGRKPKYYKRKSLPIESHGNQAFLDSTQRVLDELRDKAPYRYEEAIQFLPKAEYMPSMGDTLSGRSDGIFSVNGSGELVNGKWLNSYEWYLFVFLHEVGHCVHIFLSSDHSETSADKYAKHVLDEIGIDVTRKHWWGNRSQNCAPILP